MPRQNYSRHKRELVGAPCIAPSSLITRPRQRSRARVEGGLIDAKPEVGTQQGICVFALTHSPLETLVGDNFT